jgi:hypothetical protein
MDWIKRNLYFLIGSLVALVLMGLAGWYLYSKWEQNNALFGQLDEQYEKLKRLYEQKPHPGSDKVNNIQAAKDQQKQLRAWIQKACEHFQGIQPIPMPASGRVSEQDFSGALSRTIDQLQHAANNANVALPPKNASTGLTYSFSFEEQRPKLSFAAGSLGPLSVQLGEVKTICDVLFQARINALDAVRRERVSEDDQKGPQTDYISEKSVTNELAVLTPYEISIRCFSSELAAVLAGFANSPYGLIVKTINVEPAAAAATTEQPGVPVIPTYVPPPQPTYRPPPTLPGVDPRAARYGLRPGGRGAPPPPPQPVMPQPVYNPGPVVPAASKGGLPTALDEKQLKVTLALVVVKLTCPK